MNRFQSMAQNRNNNFYVRNNIAFTEDNIAVYNVFAHKIPIAASREDIFEYFAQFGNILNTNVHSDQRRRGQSALKIAFIDYEDPFAAARALSKADHFIYDTLFHVKAGDSWRQPNAVYGKRIRFNEINLPSNLMRRSEKGHNSSFANVNAYMIEQIFCCLSPKDQVCFALSAGFLYKIFKEFAAKNWYKITIERLQDMTDWDLREFLRIVGVYIKEVRGLVPIKGSNRMFEFLIKYANNIRRLQLSSSKFREPLLRNLLLAMPELEELRFDYCQINEMVIQLVEPLPHLRKLVLIGNSLISGLNLCLLKQITELNLYSCVNLKTEHLIAAFRELTELQALDIRRNDRFNDNIFRSLVEHCKKLEIFKMSHCTCSYHCIAQLPSLRHLEIVNTSTSRIKPELFDALAEHTADRLEILKLFTKNTLTCDTIYLIARLKKVKILTIPNHENLQNDSLRFLGRMPELQELVIRSWPEITNDSIVYLLEHCLNLHIINVQACHNITNGLLRPLVKLLRERKQRLHRQGKPVHIYTNRSNMREYILNEPLYIENQSLLRLHFEWPHPTGFDEDLYRVDFVTEQPFFDMHQNWFMNDNINETTMHFGDLTDDIFHDMFVSDRDPSEMSISDNEI